MKAKFLLLLFCACMAFTARAQYTFPACGTPWVSGTAYTQGQSVSFNKANYTAKYYTTAQPGNGDWTLVSKCGDGGIGADYSGKQRIIGYLPYWVPDFNFSSFDPSVVNHVNVAFNLFQ